MRKLLLSLLKFLGVAAGPHVSYVTVVGENGSKFKVTCAEVQNDGELLVTVIGNDTTLSMTVDLPDQPGFIELQLRKETQEFGA